MVSSHVIMIPCCTPPRTQTHIYPMSHCLVLPSIRSEHLKPTMGDIELCRVFSLADEFKYMIVRWAMP
jgi:hypothetical protein